MNKNLISGKRFCVIYSFDIEDRNKAFRMAEDICYEQTVEFPKELISDEDIIKNIVGRIEDFEKVNNQFEAKISFAVETTAFELTQFLNVIFGNISIKPFISIKRIEIVENFAKYFQGPKFGIEGIRKRLKIYDRPILATAIKPMGLSNKELADICYKFALGGIDIIKDDHGITNQIFSNFTERVYLCNEAINKANKETGANSVYFPNITAGFLDIMKRVKFAKECGVGGLLISPGLTGYDIIKVIANDENIDLPIFCHPAFQGSYVLSNSGISHGALFGQITRLAGGDAVIYPNFGGRFSFTKDECQEIVNCCRIEFGGLKQIFPAPGGGMNIESIPELFDVYQKDVIYLIGGGLFRNGPDIVKNSQYFREVIEKNFI